MNHLPSATNFSRLACLLLLLGGCAAPSPIPTRNPLPPTATPLPLPSPTMPATATPLDPVAVLDNYTTAVNAGDVDAALALFSEDAVIATHHATSWSGKRDIETFLKIGIAAHLHEEVIGTRQASGDKVTWRESFSFGGTQEQVLGEAIVQDGKIKSLRYSLIN